jgi:hypothetical protein
VWQVRRPLWESLVRMTSAAGESDLAIFQWWLKSLSDGEVDHHLLSDRYRAYVERPRFAASELVPIVAGERPVPGLVKVRYDTLHKHLRAHVPELRDVGAHFPPAERFAELGFRHLDFVWLGGGRMLLLHGPPKNGVHLFWLDRDGFSQAAFYPADPGTDYDVRLEGETLVVAVVVQRVRAEHLVLWWGP